MSQASALDQSDLNTYYKVTKFGSMPGGTEVVESPRPGLHIYRDGAYDMAHIYGDTRRNVMFGAGYASAEERLLMMHAIRRTAKGTLAGLVGPSAASDDAAQLTDQDFSNQELGRASKIVEYFTAPRPRGRWSRRVAAARSDLQRPLV